MKHIHNHSPSVSGRKLLWAILFNSLITVAEVVGGLLSGYLALLADAVHNLSDVAALGLAWLGVKGSHMPATKTSTYGYKRIEVMTAFISAVALVVIAIFILFEAYDRFRNPQIFILFEAYDRFRNPQPIRFPWIFLTVAVIGLVGNIVSILLLHSEKGKSLNMKTAFLHMFYDALSSIIVIIGGLVILVTGWYTIDVILSTAIALMIFWSSYLVLREAFGIFMEAVPAGIEFDAVLKAIQTTPNVCDVHDLHIWSLSSHEVALSCHVTIDEKDFQNGPEIVEDINRMLRNTFNIGHGTIQLEKDTCRRNDVLCNFNGERTEKA
jgi:cobalt-zinc-cadmium efflux system protein